MNIYRWKTVLSCCFLTCLLLLALGGCRPADEVEPAPAPAGTEEGLLSLEDERIIRKD